MTAEYLIWMLLLLPLLGGAASCVPRSSRGVLLGLATTMLLMALVCVPLAWGVLHQGPVTASGGWLYVDALSVVHLALLCLVLFLDATFAIGYFKHESKIGRFELPTARRYAALWCGTALALAAAFVSNNLGITWVAVEASTLLTAFLISLHRSPAAVEAMWKYLIVCSVGIAFAFMGILFFAVASQGSEPDGYLLWTRLLGAASGLDPAWVKAGFIFVLVGFGTKAGLAPMHTWLPDAHSQAPAPVSALLSGILLSTALYCIMRFVPIVDAACGSAWAHDLLKGFGLLSMAVAAVFIVSQGDLKRLLAYSSVEHMGIITLGIGIGGAGVVAALFHTISHSLCKTIGFNCAGRIGQVYGTQEMEGIRDSIRSCRPWGGGLAVTLFALIGVAPFALFVSEFLILRAAVKSQSYVSLAVFLVCAGTVFVAILRHVLEMGWRPRSELQPGEQAIEQVTPGVVSRIAVSVPLGLLLLLGLWIPAPLWEALEVAARVLGGGS